jgi:hypothetical protein
VTKVERMIFGVRVQRLLPSLVVALMCGFVFVQGYRLTGDLEWPLAVGGVQYREMASAQTLLDQGYGVEATYRGEYPWYNPLASTLVASLARITGQPVRVIVARSGPYVNLLAPITFFWLVSVLVGPWAGLAATAAFLFISGNPPLDMYEGATFTPWFFPNFLAQSFLYVGLLASYRASPSARWPWHVAVGVLLGGTFLAHTAPALVFGVVVLLMALADARGTKARRALGGMLTSFGTAIVVSLPLLYPIGWRYGFHVINRYPSESPNARLDLNETFRLLVDLATVPWLLAAVGLAIYIVTRRRERAARLVAAWVASVCLFLGFHYARLILRKLGLNLPSVVPAYHFLFYFHALACVGFGAGVALLAERAARLGRGWLGRRGGGRLETGLARGLIVAMTGIALAFSYQSYLRRPDLVMYREAGDLLHPYLPPELFDWIRQNTRNDDVFLCTNEMSLYMVPAAGRKVVSTDPNFSSPYLDWEERDRDRNQMFESLERGQLDAFDRLAARYDVKFVILSEIDDTVRNLGAVDYVYKIPPTHMRALGFTQVFEAPRIAVFRARR